MGQHGPQIVARATLNRAMPGSEKRVMMLAMTSPASVNGSARATQVKPLSVCVYCGSRTGADPIYAQSAETLGRAMSAEGVRLVYGGGGIGIMGIIATAVADAGGEVMGIIPRFLRDREVQFTRAHELVVTETMHERKQRMFEESDAFVVLPGGIGTLEETIEILTWCQLGSHAKPILLVNVKGYWDPLLALIEHVVREGFASNATQALWTVVNGPDQVLPTARRLIAAAPPVEPSLTAPTPRTL